MHAAFKPLLADTVECQRLVGRTVRLTVVATQVSMSFVPLRETYERMKNICQRNIFCSLVSLPSSIVSTMIGSRGFLVCIQEDFKHMKIFI